MGFVTACLGNARMQKTRLKRLFCELRGICIVGIQHEPSSPTRAFEPWLLTIAGNRCRTRLAKRTRRPKEISLEHPVEDSSMQAQRGQLLAEEVDLALKTWVHRARQEIVQKLAKREVVAVASKS